MDSSKLFRGGNADSSIPKKRKTSKQTKDQDKIPNPKPQSVEMEENSNPTNALDESIRDEDPLQDDPQLALKLELSEMHAQMDARLAKFDELECKYAEVLMENAGLRKQLLKNKKGTTIELTGSRGKEEVEDEIPLKERFSRPSVPKAPAVPLFLSPMSPIPQEKLTAVPPKSTVKTNFKVSSGGHLVSSDILMDDQPRSDRKPAAVPYPPLDVNNFTIWSSRLQEALYLNNVTHELEKVIILKNLICSNAEGAIWFNGLPGKNVNIDGVEFKTLLKLLGDNFCSPAYIAALREQLFTITIQENETIHKFYNRLLALLTTVGMTEQQALARSLFLRALPMHIRTALATHTQDEALDILVQRAISLESALKVSTIIATTTVVPTKTAVVNAISTSDSTMVQTSQLTELLDRVRSLEQNQRRPPRNERGSSGKPFCYKCRKQGHTAPYCKNDQMDKKDENEGKDRTNHDKKRKDQEGKENPSFDKVAQKN